jgi:VanZ family protein
LSGRSSFAAARDHAVLRSLPALAYAGFIFYLSHQPGSSVPSTVPDKPAHFALYAVFGVLLAVALTKRKGSTTMTRGLMAVFIGALYAFSDEWHQSFIPGRHADLADVAADIIGLIAGVTGYFLFRIYSERRPYSRS